MESGNKPGSCEYAPDCFKSCINGITGMQCAQVKFDALTIYIKNGLYNKKKLNFQCMLYHCMSDAEGDFAVRPCACNTAEEGCTKRYQINLFRQSKSEIYILNIVSNFRWIGLTLLSIIVPCLWCYPPMKALHWCCVGCGISGGKHTPVQHR